MALEIDMAQISCDVIGCTEISAWTLKVPDAVDALEENLCEQHYNKLRIEAPDQLQLYKRMVDTGTVEKESGN